MPSSAVAERTEFVGCTAIPVPRPRTRGGAGAEAAAGAAPTPMGKDQSTSSSAGCWSDDRRRDTRLARWRLMCVRRRWRGEGELGCDRVVFTHLLDFLEGVEKEDHPIEAE
eukprot:scaffold98034_cov63-Phaeocystis_antarctica.AAC.5